MDTPVHQSSATPFTRSPPQPSTGNSSANRSPPRAHSVLRGGAKPFTQHASHDSPDSNPMRQHPPNSDEKQLAETKLLSTLLDNTRAVPLVCKEDAHQGRVFFCQNTKEPHIQ